MCRVYHVKQAGIKFARRNVSNLRYADDNIPVAESEEELKILLMMVKEESEKANLKSTLKKKKKKKKKCKQWQMLFS